ncbi:rod shape-determining protein MreC [Utexia brackfieldae]|uniref:rod shape-determining protein MreC n=1 Tax=Utexia brackfieldae TaxID=3074108 RepID=UPI00370D6639
MKLLFSKGAPPGVQLFLALFISIALMVLDLHYHSFRYVRYYLDTAVSPLYYVSNSPLAAFDAMREMSKTRVSLIDENITLRNTLRTKNSDLQLLEQLKRENDELRKLLVSPLRRDEYKMVAQVLLANSNPYSYQIVLNKGDKNGVYTGQPVLDEQGIVGQVFSTSETTSRAILICDYQHAIPVKILRNDMSMVAVGNGCSNNLILDFLPNNVDIKVGDELVSSGLDGRFPEGYPVAKVASVNVDPHSANLVVQATPTADLKRLRYLLLLWTKDRLPSSDNQMQVQHDAHADTTTEIKTNE